MDNNNLEETISVIIKTLFIIGIFLLLLIVVYVRFTENHNYKNNLQSENIEIKKAETAINKKTEVVVNKKPENFVNKEPENFVNKKINYKEIHQRKIKTIKEKIKEKKKEYILQNIFSDMITCPAGTFIMGSSSSEYGHEEDEIQHKVTISKEFKIGKYEVTQALYEAVMEYNPSDNKGLNNPVEQVSWQDAKDFCNKLNKICASKLPSGYIFDLPTEAQWEYACRAGTSDEYNNGKNNLDEIAWYDKNSKNQTQPVGQKKPNAWGIYDMYGNIWEWCRDWKGSYSSVSVTDPTGPSRGSVRICRGGYYGSGASTCRSANRCDYPPNLRSNSRLGFRIALVPND